jgi:hypothetical protein
MILLLVVSLYAGFLTGQTATKKELKDKTYFCYTEGHTKRCYDVIEDPYAKQSIESKKY